MILSFPGLHVSYLLHTNKYEKKHDTQARGFQPEEYKRGLRESLRKYMTLSTLNKENASADKRKDNISHFILRLAYCRSEDLRRWFLTQVLDIFFRQAYRTISTPRLPKKKRRRDSLSGGLDDVS